LFTRYTQQGHHLQIGVAPAKLDRHSIAEVARIRNGTGGIVGMQEPFKGCISADGHHAYVSGHSDRTLVCFQRDGGTGRLEFQECLQDRSIQSIPAGKKGNGRVIPSARMVDGIGHVSSIASSPDGKQILVGTQHELLLAIFDRNPSTGRLSLVSTIKEGPPRSRTGVSGVESIAFAQKGKYLITGSLTGGVSLFTRDEALRKPVVEQVFYGNGMPKEWEQWEPNIKIISDLKNPVAVQYIPKESAILVAGANEHVVHAFRLKPDVPELQWLGLVRDGENGVTGLHNVYYLAVSPDGKFLYAASGSATVAVFEIKL
jgi:WD40 repeat protein